MIVAYEKTPMARFVGHLDMMRMMQRCLRMSKLPIQFSRGFHPHVRLSFAAPLSVGVIGENEMMDLPLSTVIEPALFVSRMNEVLPVSLRVRSCAMVGDDFPALMSMVAGADYRIEMEATPDNLRFPELVRKFLVLDEVRLLRSTKAGEEECNIRPFVLSASSELTPERVTLRFRSDANEKGMLKPALWLQSLCVLSGYDALPDCRIYRESILTRDKNGLKPMEAWCE